VEEKGMRLPSGFDLRYDDKKTFVDRQTAVKLSVQDLTV
jgi:hypothetical protein